MTDETLQTLEEYEGDQADAVEKYSRLCNSRLSALSIVSLIRPGMKLMQENMLMAEGILSSSLTLHTVGISFLTAVSSGAADYSDSTLGQREAAAAVFIVVRSAAAYCVVVIVSGSSKLPFSSLLVHCLYWTLTVEIIRYWSFVVDGDTRKCCSR